MALFSFRDSWNVWRRKVDEALGTVEPIPAGNVIYNNGTSGLEATNVQSAIDSIAGVKDNYIITNADVMFIHVFDGVLSLKEMLSDVFSQWRTAVSALADDELLIITAISVPYQNTLNPYRYVVASKSSNITFINFGSVATLTDKIRIKELNLASNIDDVYIRIGTIETATNQLTIADISNDVPTASTRSIDLHCIKLKKI